VLEGQGDSVLDSGKRDGYPAVAHINYSGGGNFAVWNYGANVDFLVNEFTTRFEITGRGSWRIELVPLELARVEFIPGDIAGEGDDVVIFNAGTNIPDTMTIDASLARSNFAIWSYGGGRDLLVNEIAPYQGTVIVPGETVLLVIMAEGPWSLRVDTR
jgi:hypothetical protein